jgi:transposase
LRGFGLKVGKTTARSFAGRVQELVAGHPKLEAIGEALLSVRAVLQREFNAFERRVRAMARLNARTRLLMSTPAVGPIVALTYAAAIDDPTRPGETDRSGRISKIGDASVREALYQAAHVMLTKPTKGCSELKGWAMRIAKRAGMNKAKVALARKLAVILHRMLANGTPFNPAAAAA